MNVNDTISDFKGQPTFKVVSVSNGGTFTQNGPNSATVTWTGLSYKVGDPPLDLSITVNTPANSPAGVIQDSVSATAATSGCTGGVTGTTNLGGVDGTPITGTYTLTLPSVNSGSTGAGSGTTVPTNPTNSTTATTRPASLPFTGAMGGVWQPVAGLGILGLGGGTLALARRSRRPLG
jgi:hypothetical protein